MKISPVITNQCPVGCKFCGYASQSCKKTWDNQKLFEPVIKDLTFSGVLCDQFLKGPVIFWPWGGEVFEEFDCLDETYDKFTTFFYRYGVPFRGLISTSGISFLNDRKAIDWLNTHVDCDLQFSYDRRTPWQEEVWPLIDKFYKKQIGIKATIDETNYTDLYSWVKSTEQKWGHKITGWKITAPSGSDLHFDVELLRKEFEKFSSSDLIRYFGINTKSLGPNRSSSCGIGECIMIDGDGNYFACHFGDSFNKKGSLGNVFDRGISITKIRELKNLVYDSFMDQCPDCPYKTFCFYCPHAAYLENGHVTPNKKYCDWAKTLGDVFASKTAYKTK